MLYVVFPVITHHGSLPVLISRLRQSYPFFDFLCKQISLSLHNSGVQFLLSVLVFCFTILFLIRLLNSGSTRFFHYCCGDSRNGLFEKFLDFFFERFNDDDNA